MQTQVLNPTAADYPCDPRVSTQPTEQIASETPPPPGRGGLTDASPEAALFDALRPVRRQLAAVDGYPPYFVLSDAQLAELCRVRPGNFEVLAQVRGMGQIKLVKYGGPLLAAVRHHAAEFGLELRETPDIAPAHARQSEPDRPRRREMQEAYFARGESLGDLCVALSLAPATVVERLLRWVLAQDRPSLQPWVSDTDLELLRAAAAVHGLDAQKPLWQALNGNLHYPYVRLVQGYLQAQAARADRPDSLPSLDT